MKGKDIYSLFKNKEQLLNNSQKDGGQRKGVKVNSLGTMVGLDPTLSLYDVRTGPR